MYSFQPFMVNWFFPDLAKEELGKVASKTTKCFHGCNKYCFRLENWIFGDVILYWEFFRRFILGLVGRQLGKKTQSLDRVDWIYYIWNTVWIKVALISQLCTVCTDI